MVDVITQSPGLSAEEIERYITIPIETQTSGAAQSQDGPHDFALRPVGRQAAIHLRLHLRRGAPAGPQSPLAAAAVAEQRAAADFAGQPDRRNLPLQARRPAELRACAISRRCRTGCCSAGSAPCRASSTSPAGAARPRPMSCRSISTSCIAYGMTLPQMLQALNNSNINVGGSTINIGPQVAVVRGVGLIRSLDEIRNTMLTQVGGRAGHRQRCGDGRRRPISRGSASPARTTTTTSSQGIVLMRRGEKSMPTITRVAAGGRADQQQPTSCRRACRSSASTTART